jgi:hypothetical protein
MKTIACLLLLAAPVLAHAAEIRLGASLADVKSTLGPPDGQAQINNKLILFYDRGQVQLVDGRVVGSDFLSPEDFAALQAQRAAENARAVQLRAQRITEGNALKAKKLADPSFTSAPPAYQVAFWQDFRLRYPEVSCDDEYKLALARQQEQLATQKVADLESRVTDAEDRAAHAENLARQTNYNDSFSSPFFFGGVSRERFREREDEGHDRDRFPGRDREDHDRDDRGLRTNTTSSSSLPPNQIPLPTFPIPTVPSLNLPTPNTSPGNPFPQP